MPRPVLCRVTPSDPLVTVRDKGATREIVIFEHLCSVLNSQALDNSCYWSCLKNVSTFYTRDKVNTNYISVERMFGLSYTIDMYNQWHIRVNSEPTLPISRTLARIIIKGLYSLTKLLYNIMMYTSTLLRCRVVWSPLSAGSRWAATQARRINSA